MKTKKNDSKMNERELDGLNVSYSVCRMLRQDIGMVTFGNKLIIIKCDSAIKSSKKHNK